MIPLAAPNSADSQVLSTSLESSTCFVTRAFERVLLSVEDLVNPFYLVRLAD